MKFLCFDFQCLSCSHIFEDLIRSEDENPKCPLCSAETERLLHTVGSAHAAMIDPVKQAEIMSKSRHMELRVQNRLPWRKNSYSQTSND